MEERKEGREEGRKEGRREGREEGRKEGGKKGRGKDKAFRLAGAWPLKEQSIKKQKSIETKSQKDFRSQ
jgi:predicted transposase YdaD